MRDWLQRNLPVGAVAALLYLPVTATTAVADSTSDSTQQEENQQDLSIVLSANVQNASLIRQLMEGRHAVFIGRIEAEAALYDIESMDTQDGAEIRQIRVGFAGVPPWWKSISYKTEVHYSKGDLGLGDAYIQYDFVHGGALVFGNQGSSQSLNANTGSLSRLFMEAPLPVSAFGLDNRLGVSYDFHKNLGGGHVIVFRRSANDSDQRSGMAARGYFNPKRSNNGLWHIGASVYRQKIDGDVGISTRPESHVTDIELVNTGQFSDVDHQSRYGIELAGAKGSVTGRIEGMIIDWKRFDGSHNRFAGAYLEAGFSPTGLPFRYRDGQFLRPKTSAGESAWEVAVRYSWIDLNSGDIQGGSEFNAGFAVNYYPFSSLRVQFNAIHVNSDRANSDGWLIQARLQYHW